MTWHRWVLIEIPNQTQDPSITSRYPSKYVCKGQHHENAAWVPWGNVNHERGRLRLGGQGGRVHHVVMPQKTVPLINGKPNGLSDTLVPVHPRHMCQVRDDAINK